MKKIIEKHLPLGPRILVEVDEVKEMKSKVIVLKKDYDTEITRNNSGIVRAVSPHAFIDYADGSPWVKVGDKVTFLKHAGSPREIEGKLYRILNDVDLLTVFTTEEIEIEGEENARNDAA